MCLSFVPLKAMQEWNMSIYTELLFQQGYIHNTELALSLAAEHADEADGAIPPSEPACGEAATDGGRHPRPFRRGAITSICSVALSPFR
jgi:hypothetical protein